MIEFVGVPIGSGEQGTCVRCVARDAASAPRPPGDVVAELRRLAETNPTPAGIAFIGFEPFAHPDLPQLVGSAVATGIPRVRLRTDGGALALHGNAEGVLGAGVRHLEVILRGDSAALHDRLSGRPGLFEMMSSGVRTLCDAAACRRAEVFVSAWVPVCKHNLDHLPAIVAQAAALHLDAVTLDAQGVQPDERVAQWLVAAAETGVRNLVAVAVEGYRDELPAWCTWAVLSIAVAP